MTTPVPVNTRRSQDRPRSWPDRLSQLRSEWPSTDAAAEQVRSAITDYDLLGRIMRDVLRIGYEAPRRGQRSPLEWSDGQARLRSLAAERTGQATTKPFAEAFADLAAGRTMSDVADGIGISRSQVHRLMRDHIPPTIEEIAAVAGLFDKPPTYFLEYRIHLICATVAEQLADAPERTIDVLVRLGVHAEDADGL